MRAIDQSTVGKDLFTVVKEGDSQSILRFIRTHKLREPEIVVKYGVALLGQKSTWGLFGSSMSETEYFAIIEQLLLAASDIQNVALAKQCIEILKKKFTEDSTRLVRVLALCLESIGDYTQAMISYHQQISENISNTFAMKRTYCVLRSQVGKETQAHTHLSNYLMKFPGDASAWYEMYERCLEFGDFHSAAYCLEELVLSQPLDSKLHCKLGELYATLGGLDNMKLARKHLAQALDLQPDSKRAIYSLIAVSSEYIELAAKNNEKANTFEITIAKELLKLCSEELIKSYKGNELESNVKAVVNECQVN